MTLEERITKLEKQFANFNRAYLQSQKNQTSVTSKVDTTSNNVEALTPYTETKTAYVGTTKVIFENVPEGNLTVYFDDSYEINRDRTTKRLTITFEPLKKVTDITISIL